MPTPDGKITDEERRKIREWLAFKWQKAVPCPICHLTDRWSIGNRLAQTLVFYREDMTNLSGHTTPFVMVFCENCAYTIFFSAVKMGIVAGEPTGEGDAPR